jgi:hypothetical protein
MGLPVSVGRVIRLGDCGDSAVLGNGGVIATSKSSHSAQDRCPAEIKQQAVRMVGAAA